MPADLNGCPTPATSAQSAYHREMHASVQSGRTRRARAAFLLVLAATASFLPRTSFAADPPAAPAPAPAAAGPRDGDDTPQEERPSPVSRRLWPPPDPPPRPRAPAAALPEPFDDAPAPAPAPAPVQAPTPAPTNPAPYGAAPPPPNPYYYYQAPPPGVFVELRADNPNARIDRVGAGGASTPVCIAPCRLILDRNLTYIIQGEQIPPTSPFLLPDTTNQVTLDVQAGSQTQRHVGVGLIVLGGAVSVVGLSRASSANSSSVNSQGQVTSTNHSDGWLLMALGIPAVIAGVVVFRHARTSVTSSTGATFSRRREGSQTAPRIALTPQGLTF
jgi:hypothetical protein